jgi:hypothetical protein
MVPLSSCTKGRLPSLSLHTGVPPSHSNSHKACAPQWRHTGRPGLLTTLSEPSWRSTPLAASRSGSYHSGPCRWAGCPRQKEQCKPIMQFPNLTPSPCPPSSAAPILLFVLVRTQWPPTWSQPQSIPTMSEVIHGNDSNWSSTDWTVFHAHWTLHIAVVHHPGH